eukprot:Seg1312.7 transcript_id=Seg1312.7/GoldUCD/mRNA.D3Y31 product="hypothetical protein" protein_id=Seg1312.7/GoldUCD/D3Y31
MSFVYEQQTIIKLYKQARESSRKSEKSLRQIQRKLNAQLITCSSKTGNDYRQCIKTNRSLFGLETLKCEKSVSAAEKVVVIASGSARTAYGQNMKRCGDDHVIRFKHPSNNESKIPKLCKPVNNTAVKQRIANRSAKLLSSFPNANQGSHNSGQCSTAPKRETEQNLQLQPTASNKEEISKRCSKSVNRKHPSKGIIEIPMQSKPGKKHRTAQKSVSTGFNTDVTREDNSNKKSIIKQKNSKNETVVRRDYNNNHVIVIEDNCNNKAIVKGDNINNNAIVKGGNGYNKNDRCKQSLFSAADHCYTKRLKSDTVTPKIDDNAKTSTDVDKVYDTGKLNSQMELKVEGTKLIECLLQQVSETGLKRKRVEDSTECAYSLPQNSSYDFEAPPKKFRLEQRIICDQPKVGYHSEMLSNGCVNCKAKQQFAQFHSKIPRPIQNPEAPVMFDVISYLKGMVSEAL